MWAYFDQEIIEPGTSLQSAHVVVDLRIGCCSWAGVYLTNPNQLQALGGSSRETEGSAVHLNWDANTCFTVTGASSLHGGIWLVPWTLSAAC